MSNRDHKKAYLSWRRMRTRCKAGYMAQRGLGFDPRWEIFENFLEDMGERPEGKTLDRKDNAKGYSKENCRWATPTEQALNRTSASAFGPYVYKDRARFKVDAPWIIPRWFRSSAEAVAYRDTKVLRIEEVLE